MVLGMVLPVAFGSLVAGTEIISPFPRAASNFRRQRTLLALTAGRELVLANADDTFPASVANRRFATAKTPQAVSRSTAPW